MNFLQKIIRNIRIKVASLFMPQDITQREITKVFKAKESLGQFKKELKELPRGKGRQEDIKSVGKINKINKESILKNANLSEAYKIEHVMGEVFFKKQNKYRIVDITSSLGRGIEKAIEMSGISLEDLESKLHLAENNVTLGDLVRYMESLKHLDVKEFFYKSSAVSFDSNYFITNLTKYADAYISSLGE